jgi:hypothetical protein
MERSAFVLSVFHSVMMGDALVISELRCAVNFTHIRVLLVLGLLRRIPYTPVMMVDSHGDESLPLTLKKRSGSVGCHLVFGVERILMGGRAERFCLSFELSQMRDKETMVIRRRFLGA